MIEPINGVVVVDKPLGPTSFAIVRQARRATGARKVGHGGTLDPMATGVLPICFGEATKLAQFLLDADKEYEAVISFGVETDTYDGAGEITARRSSEHLDLDDVRLALRGFLGAQSQVPPMYSALKKNGRPLYDYARAGETVERVPRVVQLHALELRGFWGRTASVGGSGGALPEPPPASGAASPSDGAASARIFIRCSKGTYVRSLAHDLGRVLGTGAHLAALRRTRSGPFTLQGAISPEALQGAPLPVISPADALRHLPTVTVGPDVARDLGHGKVVTWARAQGDDASGASGAVGDLGGALVRILAVTGELLAVAPSGASADVIRTVRVFHSSNEAAVTNSAASSNEAAITNSAARREPPL